MPAILLTTMSIECALTGKVLKRGILTEQVAESQLRRIKRSYPAAFIKKVVD